ncbi:hypothetical protein MTR_2g043810 [Medicago truncatula]|uniref:Uncharacterized protein n=1 Tax=Medicago truncatula TaxID=3880 RepID=A0A072VHK6_MEDTR|nr:hypothetical protein MTR_2g043810 [Medicago truncatula]
MCLVRMSRARKLDQIHTSGTFKPYELQMVNGHGHPTKGPLGQESEIYKSRQLESSRDQIHYLEQCIFHIRLIQSALGIPPRTFH